MLSKESKRNSKQNEIYCEIFYGFMSMNLENCQVNSFLLDTVHKLTNQPTFTCRPDSFEASTESLTKRHSGNQRR